ncbi:outer membrane lipoprotein carrier protein LolA [Solemya elarraichensis gill symbiont]|uniref:Outer-membrane lipoprotein carrier protein n=2 Tax=Solemya elarraichensis gill symbiont TaxID=1918949 RepID=A0A1T2L6M0_9GAMM|nr:outer membrane lipoprotein carrier protein LolA [Solemya elarraichensis gill symbiont]
MLLVCNTAMADASRVEGFLGGLKTLKADFSQFIESDDGVTHSQKGVLYLSRPGKFRWDYEGDEAQLIVADGNRVWLLDRDLEQVSHQSQETALRGTPAQLLADEAGVETHFTVIGSSSDGGVEWTDLAPKEADSQVELVRIGFSGEQLASLEMQDKFGQTTRFIFSDVKRNPALDRELFKFVTPPSMDVWQH